MKKSYVNVRFFENYDRTKLAEKEYFSLTYDQVAVGDLVVVDTKFGFALATVSSFLAIKPDHPDHLSNKNLKEVIAMSSRTTLSSRRFFSKAPSHTFRRSSFPAKACGFWRGEDGGHVVADYT